MPVFGIILIVCIVLLFFKLEGGLPQVQMSPESIFIGLRRDLTISASDEKSGLKKVRAALIKDGREIVLIDETFSSPDFFSGSDEKRKSYPLVIEPKKLGIQDGKGTLRIIAVDASWRNWLSGNTVWVEKEFTIDTHPPQVAVLSKFHYLNQGGTGLVIYKISEPSPQNGVMVGDRFFPGYSGQFQDPLTYLSYFALDHKQGPGTTVFIQATDEAGNSVRAGFSHQIKPKSFKKDVITISDEFLNNKMPEFDDDLGDGASGSPIDRFLKVNRELRERNYRQIVEICKNPERKKHWEGPFLRLPNSGPQAGFADHREYLYQGKVIDSQFHLGVDLASLEQSPVPASNAGKVIFADQLGIYGKTIIIDHGLGLFSMYSHLSRFDIQTGQLADKGRVIGHTGLTGLAGGDHLHFSIIIHHTFVHPVEWWDPLWIQKRIDAKLNGAESD
ncbi:MAG: hypothetical protein A2V65_06280 [Deltaproteobacteria bacterium RBG_13_49_15]|nr:MAG: hypothetical protein A2V65_06280 [Deltaproteobacteria bacterium RBG_13_49_15]